LRKTIETEPSTRLFLPWLEESTITFDALETAFTKIFGFQPRPFTYWYDWITNFGVANSIRIPAFDERRRAICDWTLSSVAA